MIPDIHGCYITLRYVVDTILKPDRKDGIFFLGDFINKGPDSKKVLDYVMKLKKQGLDIHTIMGNHEKLLLNAINNPDRYDEFINKGGDPKKVCPGSSRTLYDLGFRDAKTGY